MVFSQKLDILCLNKLSTPFIIQFFIVIYYMDVQCGPYSKINKYTIWNASIEGLFDPQIDKY